MDFKAFRLSDEAREELLATQDECTLSWTNDEGSPVSVIQSYVWREGQLWVTAFRDRPRVQALRHRPQAAVAVTSKGTDLGTERMASARVLATVHDDEDTKAWFYPAFAARAAGSPAAEQPFARALARQDRVIIQLAPVAWTSFDGALLRQPPKPRPES
jgi:hypothetical protein